MVGKKIRMRLAGAQKAQTFAEYSLIVTFIAIAVYSAYTEMGHGIKAFADTVAAFLTTVSSNF